METSEAVNEWNAAWTRVWTLVDGLDDHQAARTVPACPEWTVRNLVAHMVGLLADVLDDNEPGDHPEDWTRAQVAARSSRTLAQLRREWLSMEKDLVDWMYANTTRLLGDVVIHEQDLRGALEDPGARATPGLHALRDRSAAGFRGAVRDAGLDPLALVGDTWTFATDGEVESAPVVVRADDFDLTRALMTRRSAAQLRSWTSRGDIAPYLPCFAALGPLPERALHDGAPA